MDHPVYLGIYNGGEDIDEQRRLVIDDKGCGQLADVIKVSPFHHQNVDVRSLRMHAMSLSILDDGSEP